MERRRSKSWPGATGKSGGKGRKGKGKRSKGKGNGSKGKGKIMGGKDREYRYDGGGMNRHPEEEGVDEDGQVV